jgi:hypothetical protein
MTKSGFYRYCLARECGFSQAEALEFSVHRAVVNFSSKTQSQFPPHDGLSARLSAMAERRKDANILNEQPQVYEGEK